jgi:hypothetical protein
MMTRFNQQTAPPATAAETMRRTPQRITITVNWSLHQRLQQRCDHEGRSLSNLAAHLLELGCVPRIQT